MSDKDQQLDVEGKDLRRENHGDEGYNEISIAPLLSDLVAFADELNTRNVRETEANQKFRESQLRWQKYYVVTTAIFSAFIFCVLYAFYSVANRLAKATESEVKVGSAQLRMFDQQRSIGEATISAMKAQLAAQLAIDRPVVAPNAIFSAKVGKSPQSWTELKPNGIPPRTVAVSWHNSGNSIATDFVQTGEVISVKAGDPPPLLPECDETHPPQKQQNMTSLAPDNTMFSLWSGKGEIDPTSVEKGQMIYVVGCAYYNGLNGSRTFFSDVCLIWTADQQTQFQPCLDSNR